MSANWATKGMLEHASEVLAERFPGQSIKIIDTFDIAHAGWECDSQGALIMVDDVAEIVVIDGTYGRLPDLIEVQNKIVEYAQLIGLTRGILDRYKSLGGLDGQEFIDAQAHQKSG